MQWENFYGSSPVFIIIPDLFRKIFLFILFINFIFFLDDKIRFTQKKTIFAFSLQF